MTSAGQLRDKVRFEQRGLDANGDRLGDWDEDNGLTRSARIVFRRGSEAVLQQRLQGVQPVDITIRSDAATRLITTDWRAVDTRSGQTFNIIAITPDEGRAYITLLAEDNGNGGGG